jgi:hypothetical protein
MSSNDHSASDPRSVGTAADAVSGTDAAGAQQGSGTRRYVPRPAPGYDDVHSATAAPSGAVVGLTLMAAVLMLLSGIWSMLEGIAAIVKGTFFVVLPNYAYSWSAHSWGWTHLIVGIVVFLAGACLLADQLWARAAGVIIASLSAIANFLFIPYYPVWSIVVIAIDLFVIWALLSPRRRYA